MYHNLDSRLINNIALCAYIALRIALLIVLRIVFHIIKSLFLYFLIYIVIYYVKETRIEVYLYTGIPSETYIITR